MVTLTIEAESIDALITFMETVRQLLLEGYAAGEGWSLLEE